MNTPMLLTWLLAGLASCAVAEDAKAPKVDDPAPEFRLNDQDGKAVRLGDLCAEGWVVVAFYPKASTPG